MKYEIKKHGYGYEGIYNFINLALGCDRHFCHEIGSYQGDCIVFFKKGETYGMLNHAYGSCSGCDFYQSAYGYGNCDEVTSDALIELADHYLNSIRWFETKAEFIAYCTEKWIEGDAGYHIDKEDYVKAMRDGSVAFANQLN